MSAESDSTWKSIKATAENAVKENNIPGCAVGILHNSKVKTVAYGVTNATNQLPVQSGTVFQIGSISKTFTGTLAMQLIEKGLLDLHKPIRAYLPDVMLADSQVAENLTTFHLMTHSGGWDGDFFINTGEGADALELFVKRMDEREQISPLGKHLGYNNAGLVILGLLIETVTEESLETLLRDKIFGPIGMKSTFLNAAETISHDFVVGHYDGNVAHPWFLPRCVLPAGGIITNLEDLLAYAKVYLNNGQIDDENRLLNAETIAKMHSAQLPIWTDDGTSVGLTWFRRDLEDTYTISHGGGTNGQVTQLTLLPEHQFALAIFTNADNGGAAIRIIQDAVLGGFFNINSQKPESIDSTPEELSEFVGKYANQFTSIHTNLIEGTLVGILKYLSGFPTEEEPAPPSPPPFKIKRCAPDRLIIMDGNMKDALVDILRTPEGEIEFGRVSSRLFRFTPL